MVDPSAIELIRQPDGSYTFGSVRMTFANIFPEVQRALVIGENDEILYPALADYLRELNAAFSDCRDIRLEITAVNSRNGEFATKANNIKSIGGNTRVQRSDNQWDGRSVDIGGHEPTTLVFLEIIPQSPEGHYQGESHFLMFRRPVYGCPEERALYPVDGRIVKGLDGRYQVKIAYPNIQDLLVNFNLANVGERIAPPTHPSTHTSLHETRELAAAHIAVAPEVLVQLKEKVEEQKYRDPRTSHLVPASEMMRLYEEGRTTSEIVTGLMALSSRHITECWNMSAHETSQLNRRGQLPSWVLLFGRINNGDHPRP